MTRIVVLSARRARRGHACACAALLGVAAASPDAAATLETFERRLAAAGKKTRTLSGRFVQRKRLRLFKTEVVTKGKLYYQRPDRLRWQTLAPDASTLMVVGSRAELRLPGERARVIDLKKNRSVAALVDQLMIWLGARTGQSLARWYHLSIKQNKKEGGYRLSLKPRSTAKSLRKRIRGVEVVFNRDLLLSRIKIHHVGGDESHIAFSGIRRNTKLPPEIFR
jgi:outer membrane lipoprotein carrier protein